ncbi:hypothetical protein E2C01_032909 [Portunus trituberculatus]|uniref:Uncharacterized protein n=1 Tax=Portunus trituberculatus TaxID=210409 RepID=A0A5B7F480_PORTR|nr:hypothetical protein [Portunus trituberculatus]
MLRNKFRRPAQHQPGVSDVKIPSVTHLAEGLRGAGVRRAFGCGSVCVR